MRKLLLLLTFCACIFHLQAQTQIGSDINGEAATNYSGTSVSISSDGSRVAIGAYRNDGNGTDAGHVRVYDWNGSAWLQIGSDIDGEATWDYSGFSVSLSPDGSRIAIGAYYNDGNGNNSGHVRIYDWNGSTWVQVGSDIDGESAEDYSGYSVSLSSDGSRIAIGAYQNDSNGSDSGHVRIYDWNGSTWVQVGSDIDGESAEDYSGYSVSISADGSGVAIGAPFNDGNGSSSGHVRIYNWNGSAWIQVGNDIDGEAEDDKFGWSVSISADGDRVAIGALFNDGNGTYSGHARIYDWNGSAWVQTGSDIDGEAAGDRSGYSVSLSSDGNVIAIGAYLNDGNGNNSGHVRIYDWNGSAWEQLDNDIDGEAAGDLSGYSVSLSSDGGRVAIGARDNDGNGNNSGHVRVYHNFCSGLNQIPSVPGTYTSASSHTFEGWTHYCDENSNLLLSLDLTGSGAVVGDTEVQLKIESPTAPYYAQDCGVSPACFIDNQEGAVSFARKWEVNPTTQPSSGNVGVKFYFTQTEYDALNTELNNQGSLQLNEMEQLWFYKITNSGLDTFPAIPDITQSDVQKIYNHSTTPTTDQWVLNTKITESEFFAEYEVSSFSGGGGEGLGDVELPLRENLGSDIDGEAATNYSGTSVSISSDGSRVAIGAYRNDGNGTDAGHVRVYDWNGSAWLQIGSDIDGEATWDYSGFSVSLSPDGSRIAIGAYYNDGNGNNSGHVRIYDWNGSTWVQVGSDIDGESAEDYSGYSVSLSSDGSRIAIGAYQNDSNGSDSGHVRIYDWNGSTWVQVGSDIDGESAEDYSGYSVSISADGSGVAIGAPFNDGNGSSSGHVRIYNWNGSAWIQVGNDIDGEAEDDKFGWSVSISADGDRVAIGALFNDGNGTYSGHARIYDWNGSAWVQTGSDIDGEAAGDRSGYSVSLSSDGNVIAIGAYLNDGNGNNSGHVRIYDWNGSAWEQLDNDIDGEAAGDLSGYSVSLSSDGGRVAIGARDNDGNGNNSGHVRVYNNYICSGFNQLPITAGTYTSTYSRTSGDWTHYCDTNNKLLLSLDIGSSGAIVADDEVTLKIGSSVTDYFAQDCGATPACFIDLASGAVTFNREWDVSPTTQPITGNVGVKFYFTQTEYDSVNTRIDDLGQTQLTGIDQLWFYKVTNAALGQFPSVNDITPSDVLAIKNHASVPTTNQWVQSTKTAGSEYIAAFLVSSFSGGGGGGAEDGLSPLPIELIYFHAYADREDVQLKWATVSELNNRGFEIQRSEDGIDWEALDFINGEGTEIAATHYRYTDKNPKAGLNYYRLKQVDFDGKFQYLPVQVVDMEKSEDDVVEIFPNPAKDYINITNVKGAGLIYNLAGQLVKEVTLVENGINTIQISHLQKGMYQIVIIRDNGEQVTKRFLK
jgi:hypothetical protein